MEILPILSLLIVLTTASSFNARLERFSDSPGLYYEHKGLTQLYNTEWKLITYVNLTRLDNNFEIIL